MAAAPQIDAFALALTAATAAFGCLALWALRRRVPVRPERLRVLAALWCAGAVITMATLVGWSRALSSHAGSLAGPIEIEIVARQWVWKVQHAGGRRELNELHLPLGYPVRLRMSSEDVPHTLAIPALRLQKPVLASRETVLEFIAPAAGTYPFYCTARCGPHKAAMRGTMTVTDIREYLAWTRGEAPGESPLEAGRRLYAALRCENCHRPDGAGRGPSLAGLAGRTVTLRDGTTVVADEDYLRESIREPEARIVAGYEPVMPSFAGQLSEGQLNALVAFLKTLEGGAR